MYTSEYQGVRNVIFSVNFAKVLTHFIPLVSFTPPEYRRLEIFWCFQWVQKESSSTKWVKETIAIQKHQINEALTWILTPKSQSLTWPLVLTNILFGFTSLNEETKSWYFTHRKNNILYYINLFTYLPGISIKYLTGTYMRPKLPPYRPTQLIRFNA